MRLLPKGFALDNKKWRVNIDISDGKIIGREESDIIKDINMLADNSVPSCLIDIDRSQGRQSQKKLIIDFLQQRPNKFWVGGGVKSFSEMENLLNKGAKGIIVGSAIFNKDGVNTSYIKELSRSFESELFIISIDFYNEKICTKGFTNKTNISKEIVLEQIYDLCKGNCQIQTVDIASSTKRLQPNWCAIESIREKYPKLEWWYAGNLMSWQDMIKIMNLSVCPTVGRAYLQGKLGLE
ncbi:hypothetical protein HZI73_16805 [Vallitalea pronyensis]|uniref:1-(5-phosphoribosyl)-5-[(5-phosphoribosylamino)methylideneamino] imidazole-4-carboxamide isomerase n=1 Tax=Vallitalea pronyensis TaxID=1348613 RepID=A0A8J8ML41_9FIRM|nr:HisA/HisF-related TIM barrel protein [Vallitalea pronyensis]QUI23852.1 hypothetical protein HZI73_16805 [Vallitalea pronyensis]